MVSQKQWFKFSIRNLKFLRMSNSLIVHKVYISLQIIPKAMDKYIAKLNKLYNVYIAWSMYVLGTITF